MDFSKTNSIFYIFLLSKTDRSNSDGGFSGHSGIQRYTTSKYTNAIHAGLCTLTPTYDRPPRSTSSSSQPDYRVCYHNHDMEHEMIYNHNNVEFLVNFVLFLYKQIFDFQELARSFSVPGRDYLDDHDEEDGPDNRGLMAMEGSSYTRNMIRNGNPNYKDSAV